MGIRPYIVGLDWDGTCVSGTWKKDVQVINQEVIDKAIAFKRAGAMVSLWTAREGEPLQEAVEQAAALGLHFDSVNENAPPIAQWNNEQGQDFGKRKIFCDIYVDDRAHGSIEYYLQMEVIGLYDDDFFKEDWVSETVEVISV